MSFTDLADTTAYGIASSGSTLILSAAALTDVVAGDLIVIAWTAEASSLTVSSCADDGGGGQTYDISNAPRSGLTLSHGVIICKANGNNFGTNITITLSGSVARRSATLMAFHASNGNPVLDTIAGNGPDNASPVDTAASGTLSDSDSLGVHTQGWRGTTGAVSGYSQTSPAGWTTPGSQGASGGATNRDETNISFKLSIGATTSFTAAATYSNLAAAHSFLLTFTDVALPFKPRRSGFRRAWAGR